MLAHRHRVAAEQRYGKAVDRLLQPFDKGRVPLVASGAAITEQHAQRLRALGREIGQVHRDQLPGDIGRIGVGQKMDALDHHVVRHHQLVPPERHHRDIVGQAACGGVGGDRLQPVDKI